MHETIDVLEDYLVKEYPGILELLLIDQTKNQYNEIEEKNIVWRWCNR